MGVDADLRYAWRMLRQDRAFTATAVIALALGIGANTAVFSVVRAVLLRPLGYRNPDHLVAIWETNAQGGLLRKLTSGPNFLDWKEQSRSFEGLTAYSCFTQTLYDEGEPDRIVTCGVTEGFFPFLGFAPALGRDFVPDDHAAKHAPAVILSSALWERRYGRDPHILGRHVILDERSETVIGVMPPGFRHPDTKAETHVVEAWHAMPPAAPYRSMDYLSVLARRKPEVSLDHARAEMRGIGQRLARAYPGSNGAFEVQTVPLQDAQVGTAGRPLWLLLGAVGLLLLIACANVANLWLARAVARRREFAIRLALGSGSVRLFRQLACESLLLSTLAGALGLLLARWGVHAMLTVGGAAIPRAEEVHLDSWVLAFGCLLTTLTGLGFGLLPAWQANRVDLNDCLQATGKAAGGSQTQNRLRSTLVAAELALTLILVTGAGLLLRSFWHIQNIPLGFARDRVLTAEVKLPPLRQANDPRTIQFLRDLLERVRQLPGVEEAGAIGTVPLSATGPREAELPFSIEGRAEPLPQVVQDALFSAATPEYFRAMGIPLRRGRLFDARDTLQSPFVLVINEAFARRYFPGRDPLGKRITPALRHIDTEWLRIVGVVADVRQKSLFGDIKPQAYVPHAQRGWPSMTLVVRGRTDLRALVSPLRQILRNMDRSRPISNIKTTGELFTEAITGRRFALCLLVLFAGLALLVAAIGIYGVVAYGISQRTREFGLRMALGARPADVLHLVLRDSLRMAFAGLVAGVAGALALNRLLSGLLYGVTPSDPLTFFAVAAFLAGVAVCAAWLPARRATRIDPNAALRHE